MALARDDSKKRTSCLGVLADVFFDFEFVGAGFVFGDDTPDDCDAAFLDLLFLGLQVLEEIAETHFGDDGRPRLRDHFVFFSQLCEQPIPAGNDGVFVAMHEAKFEFAEPVWERLGLSARE